MGGGVDRRWLGTLRLISDSGAVTTTDAVVARYHFTVGLGTPGEELLIAATDQFPADTLRVHSPFGAYVPLVLPTVARVAAFPQGDVTQNGFITSQDLVSLVGYVFKGQSLPDPDLGNVDGQPAGYSELDRREPGQIELAYFGLFPQFIGQGLGKYFLGWTLDRAWSYGPDRVWLHTCDLDHPAALPNYQQAGFVVFDEQMIQQVVPQRS